MKTRNILVTIPCEPPAVADGFEISYYRLMDEAKEKYQFNKYQLESAGIQWVYQGPARLTLNAIAFGYIGNGEYEIFSVWDDNAEVWEAWCSAYDGKPFDFEAFQAERTAANYRAPEAETDRPLFFANGDVDEAGTGDGQELEELF